MNTIQAILLGILQGATEFIPVSSSGHLVLVPWALGWPSPSLAFDIVLHLGTLLAVVTVFWQDLTQLFVAWLASVRGAFAHPGRTPGQDRSTTSAVSSQARVAWWVLLATIPAGLMGLLWQDSFESLFGSPRWVALFLLLTGLWLVTAERLGRREKQAEQLTLREALLIGVAQGCAIAPGISRSGATIGAGLVAGLKRESAARFSFLLSIPIILATALLPTIKLISSGGLAIPGLPTAAGFIAAFVTGTICIRWLLAQLRRRSLIAFAIYCFVAGSLALVLTFVR